MNIEEKSTVKRTLAKKHNMLTVICSTVTMKFVRKFLARVNASKQESLDIGLLILTESVREKTLPKIFDESNIVMLREQAAVIGEI